MKIQRNVSNFIFGAPAESSWSEPLALESFNEPFYK